MAGGPSTIRTMAAPIPGAGRDFARFGLTRFCRIALLGGALLLAAPAGGALAQPHAISHQAAASRAAVLPVSKPAREKPVRETVAPRQKSAEPARREAEAEGRGFTFQGRKVRVDVVKAELPGLGPDNRAPAVLILHGAHGLGDGSLYYPQASALAARGITAFVVHYFDGIPQARKAAPSLHDEREQVILEAVGYVARQSYVDPDRIGVFGLSLGGFHALSLGSRDSRIQAVVDQVGAMPAEVQRRGVTYMPPTLVLHGDKDRTVPVRRARELVSLMEQLGTEHEVKIYAGEGHTFRGAARTDSIARTVDFFSRHLAADRGLLKKDLDIDIALGPALPPTLPDRDYAPPRDTLADEKLLQRPDFRSAAE